MKPKTRLHRPGESHGEQHQLTQPVGVTEVDRFEVAASGFECCEESLDALTTSVIPQGCLRSGVGDVVSDANTEGKAQEQPIGKQLLADELVVCCRAIDPNMTEKLLEAIEQVHPLAAVEVALLVEHCPEQGKGDAFIRCCQHQDREYKLAENLSFCLPFPD